MARSAEFSDAPSPQCANSFAPPSPHLNNMTVHDEIDTYLAADLHKELSAEERNALHSHLVECASCRKLYQETKIMNKVLEENLAAEKADSRFEQRMLTGFRNRILQKSGGIA